MPVDKRLSRHTLTVENAGSNPAGHAKFAETAVFEEWVGKEVRYFSGSGREYVATVDAIPKNPGHGYSPLPTVSLSFRNERNKLVRKARVVPEEQNRKRQVWRPEEDSVPFV